MGTMKSIHRVGWTRVLLLVVVGAMILTACSSSDDSGADEVMFQAVDTVEGETRAVVAGNDGGESAGEPASANLSGTSSVIDAKIIRDGSIDIRIGQGEFDVKTAEIRAIASDLGGYLSSGSTHIEELEDERYAVGWYTLKIPSDRFDDAVDRVEKLGERVSASLTSQDVTEEYIDLEGRLNYWREQEAFYTRLMSEATAIDDLVTLQTRMQDVLLNIEQIEGRMRYLDSRTSLATLTVGVTEVPIDTAPVEPVPTEPGPIAEAFDQAGEVLLATVSFIIVAAAVALPLGMVVLIAYGLFRLFTRGGRKPNPA